MKKLNLGSGRDIKAGWINVDSVAGPGIDVVADLDNCRNQPLPFADDEIDEFQLKHVIEHINDTLGLMQELHRIAKPLAKATVILPFGASDDTWEDPTHKRPFFPKAFFYFSQPCYWRADYGYRGDWQYFRVELSVSSKRYGGMKREELDFLITHHRNIVEEMKVELAAIKPAREQKRELGALVTPDIVFV